MTNKIARLRIELAYVEPCIWRSIEVSVSSNLRALHEVIQAVMPWENRHMFEFRIGDRVYSETDPGGEDWGRKAYQAKSMRLSTLIDRGITEFNYTYDFGDDWQHRVKIECVEDGATDIDYPAFVAGARTAPPEDVGGPPGFMDFIEAISNRSHPNHKDMVRWYGRPFHPTDFGEAAIVARVRELAAKRKVALDAFARSRIRGIS